MERKSRREWIMEAKEQGCEWADEAIENAENADADGDGLEAKHKSLSMTLLSAFNWRKSPQGSSYWRNIYNDLISQDK